MSRLRRIALLVLLVLGASVPVRAQDTMLQVTSPRSDAVINNSDVAIEFQVNGFKLVPSNVPLSEAGKRPEANRQGEGHLHLMLDLQPVIVWEQNVPYTLQNVPLGEHQLMVEVVNNDHSSLSPPVMQRIRFRTAMMIPSTGQQDSSAASQSQVMIVIATAFLAVGALLLRRKAMHTRASMNRYG